MKTKDMSSFAMAVTIISLLIAAVLLFSGSVTVSLGEETMDVKALLTSGAAISYKEVEKLEYLDSFDGGSRLWGIESFQLKAGTFSSESYGTYTRYTYAHCFCGIYIQVRGKVYIINDKNEEQTKILFESIAQKVSQKG